MDGVHPPVQLAEPGKVVAYRREISGDGSAREDKRQSEHGEQPGIEKSMDSDDALAGTLKHVDAERLQFSRLTVRPVDGERGQPLAATVTTRSRPPSLCMAARKRPMSSVPCSQSSNGGMVNVASSWSSATSASTS